jgi:hypothetical protein
VNIRRPASINGNVVGQYTAGETLVYDTKFLNESRTWISYIGDSGNRNYCCAVDSNGSWYVELVVSPNNSCPINNPAEGNGKSDVNYGQYEALYYHGTPALHWMGTPTGGSRGNKCCWLCNQGCTVLSYLYWKKITPV